MRKGMFNFMLWGAVLILGLSIGHLTNKSFSDIDGISFF